MITRILCLQYLRTVLAGVIISLAVASVAVADDAAENNAACPNGQVLGTGMITHVCWDCVLPIRISGVYLGGGSSNAPDGAADPKPLCLCQDNNGVYRPGTQYGMWQPARLVETVRIPYCSPTLGGVMLQHDTTHIGTPGYHNSDDRPQHKAFYQYHYFAYPMMIMLDLFIKPHCNPGGFMDLDLMYMSEVDPTWNDDELAFYLNPESAIFANPVALAACAGDAALVASGGQPSKTLFWCAGSWGGLYPLTGHVRANSSPPRSASLISARALAALHRRGLARQTMGNEAMCKNAIQPTLPKSQYKFEQIYPLPESNGNHWIGAPTYEWGEWRNVPSVGEDYINLIWRWSDCCTQFE